MADPVMSTFFALSLLASARAAQSGRVRDGLLAGPPAALAVLSKASGVLLLFVPVAAWLALSRPRRRGLPALGAALAATAGLVAWPLWRFLEASRSMAERNVGGGAAGSLDRIARNLGLVAEWFPGWWTLPLVLLALGGALGAIVRRDRPGLYLAAAGLLPLAFLVVTATFWYPRYILYAAVPGVILAARALAQLVGWAASRLGVPAGGPRHALLGAATALALIPAVRADSLGVDGPEPHADARPGAPAVRGRLAVRLRRRRDGAVRQGRASPTPRGPDGRRQQPSAPHDARGPGRRVSKDPRGSGSRTCPSSAPTSCRSSRGGPGSARRWSWSRRCRRGENGRRPSPGRRSAPRSPSRRASRTATSATRCIASLRRVDRTDRRPGLPLPTSSLRIGFAVCRRAST